MKIPFHKPYYDEQDAEAVAGSLRSGVLVGDGPATHRASQVLAEFLGCRHVLLTTSCTHALELALMALDLSSEDEVIVPSFTFVSSPNAILRQGARVVFSDITPDTLTMDPQDLARRLTAHTAAVMPVVYAGVSPDMDAIMTLASARGIRVVEDAAQGIGAAYQGRHAGTSGHCGCYSFHETKNYSTGEGGAFATNDDELMKRAEIAREKGTNRKQFLLGLVDKYTWVAPGSSYLPPDSMAALLMSQLAKVPIVQPLRKNIHDRYMADLQSLVDSGKITLPVLPPGIQSNYHLFYVLMEDELTRNRALAFFRERGIGTVFHYLPLHLSPMGRSLGYGPGDFPVTESVSGRLIRLPIYPALTPRDQEDVTATMKALFA